MVFAMSVTFWVKLASSAVCHFTTFPLFPLSVIAPGTLFLQAVVLVAESVPATVTFAVTVNVTAVV